MGTYKLDPPQRHWSIEVDCMVPASRKISFFPAIQSATSCALSSGVREVQPLEKGIPIRCCDEFADGVSSFSVRKPGINENSVTVRPNHLR